MATTPKVVSWLVMASPLAALLVTPTITKDGKVELDVWAYAAATCFILVATHGALHLVESAAIDISGTLIVASSAIAPWWLPAATETFGHNAMAALHLVGADASVLTSGPGGWGMREHLVFCGLAFAYLFAVDAVVIVFAGRGTSSARAARSQGEAVAILNGLISVLLVRHMLEFAFAAEVAEATSPKFCLQIPGSLMQTLKPPLWETSISNTVGAIVACLMVYDLLFYTFNRVVCTKLLGLASVQSHAHGYPWVFFVASYFRLCAVVFVALSPLGCHGGTVVAFMTLCEMLDSMHSRGIPVPLPFFFGTHTPSGKSQGNYGKYMTVWDCLCNTYT